MAEHTQSNHSDIPPPPGGEYSWHDVAHEVHNWHPDLQVHVDRKLDEHGVERPDRVAVPRLALVSESEPSAAEAEPPKAASLKKEKISEIPRDPSEKIADAFADGQNALLKLSNDPGFHQRCIKEGVDPYADMDKPKYWRLFREHAGDRVRRLRDKVGNTPQLSAFELMAAAPSFILEDAAVKHGQSASKDSIRRSKETLSTFNGLIRTFADDFPEARASTLILGLMNTANMTIEDAGLRHRAEQTIRNNVRGAQHEKVFGQILTKAGRKPRPATPAEDLEGIDWVALDDHGRPLYIDVKASLTEIQRRQDAHDDAFALEGSNKMVMYSLVRDEELRDTFYIPDELAASKADALNDLLRQAAAPKTAYRTG